MPTYRVGVLLTASGGSFQRGMRAAAGATRKTQSALQRAGGSATAFGVRTDEAGRRAQSALQRASGQARRMGSALGRASGSARAGLDRTSRAAGRMGSAFERAAGRGRRALDNLRLRAVRTGQAVATAAGRGSGRGSGLVGAAGLATGGYGLARLVGREVDRADRYHAAGVESLRSEDTAGLSAAELHDRAAAFGDRLRAEVDATAGRAEIRVDSGELLAAAEEYGRRTGNWAGAIDRLEAFATGIQRGDAAGGVIGGFSAEMEKFGGAAQTPDGLLEIIALAVQGQREGALYMRDMAESGGRAASQWAAVEPGMDGIRSFFRTAQASMAAAGGKRDVAMTQVEALIAALYRPDLAEQGIYGAQDRSPAAVARDMAALPADRRAKVADESLRGLLAYLGTDAGAAFDARVGAALERADVAALRAETEAHASTSAARIVAGRDRAANTAGDVIRGPLGPAVTWASEHQDAIMGAAGAAAAAGVVARFGRGLLRRAAGGRSGGAVETAAGGPRRYGRTPAERRSGLGAPGLVRTMHVTTLIAGRTVGGGLNGAAGGGRGGVLGRAGGKSGFLRRAAGRVGGLSRAAGRRVPLLGVALGVAGTAASLASGDRGGAARQAGGVAGGLGGAALGAVIGGAIGSVVPVVGTAIGAGLGSFAGGWLGGELGSAGAASALERAAGMDEQTRAQRRAEARRRWRAGDGGEEAVPDDGASALERAAGMDEQTRAQRRAEARRRWRAGDGGEEAVPDDGEQPLGRDALRRQMREGFAARVHNGNVDNSVRVGPPVINIHSETGDPAEISEAIAEQLVETVERRIRHNEERIQDLTYSDPDPTLLL